MIAGGHLLQERALDWLRLGLARGGWLPLHSAEGATLVTDAELGWCLVLGLVRQAVESEPPGMRLTARGRQVLGPQRPMGQHGLTAVERAARRGGA